MALFGDNHRGFTDDRFDCTVFNAGCLIRRRTDERDYSPAVGLLYEDGSVERRELKSAKDDQWTDVSESKEAEVEMFENEEGLKRFIAELADLGADSLDFRVAVDGFLSGNDVSDGTRKILLEAMEQCT